MSQFGFMKRVGASDRAVAVLNDQPQLFTTLVLVLVGLAAQCGFLYFIHYATLKPEQKNKKKKEDGRKRAGTGAAGGKGGGGGSGSTRFFGFRRS
ncbi:uncharacterized protein J7T54_005002 [Emericellopsis cladophorae]|uniref:Uncharacterized protein n=1 Tax=Emericellopsis cladophorae TaxID=2686198 RepID=A0A9Q0BEG4_9HYPO|nr:uncharacterized protein J7T54_005002 [Emericellopsis cladophorae]KAI6781836.1 hypothetical protein J7T54_005002 [Emericellopsis cladophorae]